MTNHSSNTTDPYDSAVHITVPGPVPSHVTDRPGDRPGAAMRPPTVRPPSARRPSACPPSARSTSTGAGGSERGQSTVEYALLLLGAAAIALVLVAWVTRTDMIGRLFDTVIGRILSQA